MPVSNQYRERADIANFARVTLLLYCLCLLITLSGWTEDRTTRLFGFIVAFLLTGGAIVIGMFLMAPIRRLSRRLENEVANARVGRQFRNREALEQYASQHYADILLHEQRIVAEHARRFEDPQWIAFLKARRGQGGSEVLDWYNEDLDLLEEAIEASCVQALGETDTPGPREDRTDDDT